MLNVSVVEADEGRTPYKIQNQLDDRGLVAELLHIEVYM
jgi:hypothetical protein